MTTRSAPRCLAALAGLALATAAHAQLVVNGDFETGTLSGWTQFGDTGYTGVWDGFPNGGLWSAYFGPFTPGGIKQTITANAGDRLTVKFWLVSEDGLTPNSCTVTLDNQSVATFTDFIEPGYVQYTATITIANANPELVFTFTDEPGYLDIDDVTVTREAAACYANCDNSTSTPVLNVADFTCFLQKFAASDPYANCDASTNVPVLNVADFTCFLQKFAAGCS